MANSLSLSGQWLGFFSYGPDYGEKLFGEKVQFRLFLKDIEDGQFEGTCADLEGVGSSFEISNIKGFIDNTFISFTKEYSAYSVIDEEGNTSLHAQMQQPRISYSGHFDKSLNLFAGKWEILANETLYNDGSLVEISTGNWQMVKDETP